MAIFQEGFKFSAISSEDMTDKQFHVIKYTDDRKVGLCGVGERMCGVLQNKPNVGHVAEVMVTGLSKVKVGEANITAGNGVTADATGQVIAEVEGSYTFGQMDSNGTTGLIGTALIGAFTPNLVAAKDI